MNFNKFDEFGNYIGEGESDTSDSSQNEMEQNDFDVANDDNANNSLVLPEDKEYYQDPRDVYPKYTTVKNEAEDRQSYNEPIIKPEIHKVIAADLKERPRTVYNVEFLKGMFENESRIRNIAFVGAIGHGKTELIDCLIKETHPGITEKVVSKKDITNQIFGEGRKLERLGWMDRTFMEKRRRISIMTEVMSLIGEDLEGRQWALNLIDTPGHPDFLDQVHVGLAMADGVVFCIDVIEGLTNVGKRLLNSVCDSKLPIVLVINKIDRLILEMKIPPEEAHRKIRRVIEEVNTYLGQAQYPKRLSPELFNVAFTSAQFSLCFTCESFGYMYNRKVQAKYNFNNEFSLTVDTKKTEAKAFGQRLWGDYRIENNKIISSSSNELKHPFVEFVLNPIYKVFSHVLSCEPDEWSKLLKVPLTTKEKQLNIAPLLQIALSSIFGTFSSIIQIFCEKLPSPIDKTINNNASIVAHAVKFVPSTDGSNIYALVRIFRGVLEEGMNLFVLPESTRDEKNDNPNIEIGKISLPHVRYSTPIKKALPGMIVRLESSNPKLTEISTITNVLEQCLPPLILPPSYMKIAVEPLDPSKYDEMVGSITSALLCYPSLKVLVTMNREHTLIGTGEMYLDCVMNDIRNSFATIEVKVSDPFTLFNETVNSKSVTICYAKIDENNKIGIIAEPLNAPTLFDLESGALGRSKDLSKSLVSLGWDQMAADNVICFEPDTIFGPNILVDDLLPPKPEISPVIKKLIIRSFAWATNQGPLCDEMMRGIRFRIVEANLNSKQITPVKIIPAFRKAIFASFLAASPKLMEPINFVEIITPGICIPFIKTLIEKRRGRDLGEKVIPGTPLSIYTAEVPLIDSFGLEVDVRFKTKGKAFALQYFDRWGLVPGDPFQIFYLFMNLLLKQEGEKASLKILMFLNIVMMI